MEVLRDDFVTFPFFSIKPIPLFDHLIITPSVLFHNFIKVRDTIADICSPHPIAVDVNVEESGSNSN
jgi:hypothetical protein